MSSGNDDKAPEGYYEWIKNRGNAQWENSKPWLEDMYLKYFSNDNKASYATRDTLDKTQLVSDKEGVLSPVGKLQKGVNDTVAGQVGQGGAAEGVGDTFSEEGFNRVERGGKDDSGSYVPSLGGAGESAAGYGKSAAGGVGNAASGAADTGKNAAGSVGGAASGAVGSLGGVLGGGNKSDEKDNQ